MFFNKSKEQLQQREKELQAALSLIDKYENEFKDIIDKTAKLNEVNSSIKASEEKLGELNEKYQTGLNLYKSLEEEINLFEDTLEVNSYGLYKPQFSFETSETYKKELETNYEKQKGLIKADNAVVCHIEWTVGGSKTEGRKMVNQYKKLMLYAFNGECDGLISKVKWNNVNKIKERIRKAFDSINKLGVTQNVFITEEFLETKLEELALTYEYEQKKYEEKEEQRAIREQMREEEKAQKELEKAQKEAEDEERRYQKALEKAKEELLGGQSRNTVLLEEQIKELEAKLEEAHQKKERAIALAQLTKVGHIYVISNLGSFGEDVYKIGMTRRLDPLDRVRELGDASVPFQFDIHAIIYSENVPQLENELHKTFHHRRLNRVNTKKEFFKVSLDEIAEVVNKHSNAEIEFTKMAEAREFRETLSILNASEKVDTDSDIESRFPFQIL